MADNRPRGRKRNVSGQGTGVNLRGDGLGTGPVGSGISGKGSSGSGGGSRGGRGMGGLPLIVLIIIALLGGGGSLGGLLGGGSSGGSSCGISRSGTPGDNRITKRQQTGCKGMKQFPCGPFCIFTGKGTLKSWINQRTSRRNLCKCATVMRKPRHGTVCGSGRNGRGA